MAKELIEDKIASWERFQARTAFLLPILRAMELGYLSTAFAIAIFLASSPSGFLSRLVASVWGAGFPAGALFGPLFSALAILMGFASGPYVDAARVMRRDAQQFSDTAKASLEWLTPRKSRFVKDAPNDVKQSLRSVASRSHDFLKANTFDLASEVDLAQMAPALAHYWDKRAGSAIITEDRTPPVVRMKSIKTLRLKVVGLVALGAAMTSVYIGHIVCVRSISASTLLGVTLAVYLVWWRLKNALLPFKAI